MRNERICAAAWLCANVDRCLTHKPYLHSVQAGTPLHTTCSSSSSVATCCASSLRNLLCTAPHFVRTLHVAEPYSIHTPIDLHFEVGPSKYGIWFAQNRLVGEVASIMIVSFSSPARQHLEGNLTVTIRSVNELQSFLIESQSSPICTICANLFSKRKEVAYSMC